jgi:hypothetical protein
MATPQCGDWILIDCKSDSICGFITDVSDTNLITISCSDGKEIFCNSENLSLLDPVSTVGKYRVLPVLGHWSLKMP